MGKMGGEVCKSATSKTRLDPLELIRITCVSLLASVNPICVETPAMKRMLTYLAFGLAALTILVGPSFAADLAKPAEPAKAAEVFAPQPFSGLYIGVLAGHATGTTNDADGFKFPRDGYTGTGLIGYNHRVPNASHIVLGAEADLGLTGISGATNAGGFTVTGTNKVLGSIRARAGYAMASSMIYVTGGLAMTNAKLAVESIGSDSTNRLNGYVLGGGLETVLLGNLGIRIEYLRYQWRDQDYTIGGASTGKLGSHDDHIRAGLIVRLN
jgi:outer membrane immunogenic protein